MGGQQIVNIMKLHRNITKMTIENCSDENDIVVYKHNSRYKREAASMVIFPHLNCEEAMS